MKPAFRAALAIFVKILTKMEKRYYEAPATEVVEVQARCVICGSERGLTETYTISSNSYGDGDFE